MISQQGQFRLLTRHFLRQFIDNDLLSPEADQHQGLAVTVAVLLLPGVLVPTVKLFAYAYPFWTEAQRDAQSWGDKCLFVLLAMFVLAGVAVLNWDALTVNRRDSFALGLLPVRASVMLRAKLASLAMLLGVFAAAIIGAGPVWFPLVMLSGAPHATFGQLGRLAAGHAVSTLAAAAFAFCAVVALHGLLLNLLGSSAFRRVGTWVQSLAVFLLALAFLMLPLLMTAVEPMKRAAHPAMFWAPPFWFLGIYQVVAGHGDPAWRELASIGWLGLAVTMVVALAANMAGFNRHARRAAEAVEGRAELSGLLRRAGRLAGLAGGGRRPDVRAFVMFTLRTLARSPRHRLVLAASIGGGFALAAVSIVSSVWRSSRWVAPPIEAYLSVQLLLVFALVAGVRVAAARPAELPARWVLRLLYPGSPGPWLCGLRRAVLVGIVVPVLLVLLPAHVHLIGWDAAARHLILGVMLSAGLIEALFLTFRKVPFACTHVSGRGGPNVGWTWYWFGFSFYAYTLANIEALMVRSAVAFMWLLPFALATLGALVWYRRRSLNDGLGLQFVDEPAWQTQTLDLET